MNPAQPSPYETHLKEVRDMEDCWDEIGLDHYELAKVLQAHLVMSTAGKNFYKNEDPGQIDRLWTMILATIPGFVLKALVQGTLIPLMDVDGQYKTWAEKSQLVRYKPDGTEEKLPTIYMCQVVRIEDKKANHMTWREVSATLAVMEQYLDHVNAAYPNCQDSIIEGADRELLDSIDSVVKTREGVQPAGAYLRGKHGLGKLVADRFDDLKIFIKALRSRINMVGDEDGPMDYPLSEVGYTHHQKSCFDNHRQHTSSNWLMGLFAACAHHINGNRHASFKVRRIVVHRILDRIEAKHGDVIITLLTRAWAFDGSGFMTKFPGSSYDNAKDVKDEDLARYNKLGYLEIENQAISEWVGLIRLRTAALEEAKAAWQKAKKERLEKLEAQKRLIDSNLDSINRQLEDLANWSD